MPALEKYIDQADELAQSVVNAWGVNVDAGNAADLSEEFKALLDRACRYQTSKRIADNHCQFKVLSQQEEAEVEATRQAFAESYKAFQEKHAATATS